MATFLQNIQDVLAIFAHADPALAGLPIPLIAGTIGSTTTISDPALSRGTTQNARYDGREGEIVESAHADLNKVWAVDNGGLSGSTLTFSPAISASSGSGIEFLLYMLGLSPDNVRRAINDAIRSTDVPHIWTPSMLDDADFEANDLTQWAALGTPSTREFVTAAAQILQGERALHLVADAADEGAQSNTFRVTESESLLVSVNMRVDVANYDIELINVTDNNATVRTDSLEEEDYTELRYSQVVPDGAEEMYLQFASQAASDACYVSGPVAIQSQWERAYVAPSWLTEPERQVEKAIYLPQGYASPDASQAYAALTRQYDSWPMPDFIRADRFANRVRVQFKGTSLGPIALICHRTFATLSADTDTTNLDRQYLAHQAAVNLTRYATGKDWRAIHVQSGRAARQIAEFRGYGKQETVVRERLLWR